MARGLQPGCSARQPRHDGRPGGTGVGRGARCQAGLSDRDLGWRLMALEPELARRSVCQRHAARPTMNVMPSVPSLGPRGEGWLVLQVMMLALVAAGGVI